MKLSNKVSSGFKVLGRTKMKKQILFTFLSLQSILRTFAQKPNTDCVPLQYSSFYSCRLKSNEKKSCVAHILLAKKDDGGITLKTNYVLQYIPTAYYDGPDPSKNAKKVEGVLWSTDGLGNINEFVNKVYEPENQKKALEQQCSATSGWFAKAGGHFVKGQMASPSDYTDNNLKRSTFHYINVIPMWGPFNLGNWDYRFDVPFNRLYKENKDGTLAVSYSILTERYDPLYRVISGGYDRLKCPTDQAKFLQLEHKKTQIPIPKIIYKVIEPLNVGKPSAGKKHKAVFMAMVNDPTMTKAASEEYFKNNFCKKNICNDIYFHDEYTWFRKGYFYCDIGMKVKPDGIVEKGFTTACEFTPEIEKKLEFGEYKNWHTSSYDKTLLKQQ